MKIAFLFLTALALVAFRQPKNPVTTLKGMKKLLKGGFAYVPGGHTVLDADTLSCQGFFTMKGEVTNGNYLEYLWSVRKNGGEAAYLAALPDSTGWKPYGFDDRTAGMFFRHPAYRDYPVVNITKTQAEDYCKWLTDVWRKNTGNNDLVFRLPKRSEFLRAANGTALKRSYSWDGPYLRNRNGAYLCNFAQNGAEGITRDTATGGLKVVYPQELFTGGNAASSDLTAPSASYWPNEFGIYNLNGNVAEMIADGNMAVGGSWRSPGYDVRNDAIAEFSGSSPETGFRPVMTFVEKSE
jgi:formylglycine-generating enzyme